MPVFEFHHLTRSLSNKLILFLSHFWRCSLLTTFLWRVYRYSRYANECNVFIMHQKCIVTSFCALYVVISCVVYRVCITATVSLGRSSYLNVMVLIYFFKKWHRPKQKAERRAFMKSWGIVPYFLCLNCSLLCACSWYLTSGKPLNVYRVYTYSSYTLCLSITVLNMSH